MTMSLRCSIALFTLTLMLTACSRTADAPRVAAAPSQAAEAASVTGATHAIAWHAATNDAEIDAAFAEARRDTRPLFVYWGAKWCPPCNQVKATLFNRHDFIERSRAFVPVYVDGDRPGAQKIGARFHVSGYPTMVLFTSQGQELTRLPGEVDAARYLEVLTLGMAARRPVKAVLADALAGGARLTPDEWRLLAFYSWETDHQQLVANTGPASVLDRLATNCPASLPEVAQRLRLQALAASDPKTTAPGVASQRALLTLLADTEASRAQADLLVGAAADIVRAASAAGTPSRVELRLAFEAALTRLQHDQTLSRADRLAALDARVDLVRIDAVKKAAVPASAFAETLVADVRETAARDDREITDAYERQSVITAAADTLADVGLVAESDALLTSNLTRSHSPYYLMSMLSRHAQTRGDRAAALDWSARAFDASEGPATRLQWGASHLALLVEMAPRDEARIERTATQMLTEAAATPDAFYERSGRSLQRLGASLQRWNADGTHAAAMHRLQTRLDAVCAALTTADPHRTACQRLLVASATKPA